jgi:hypothetical protein
MQQQRYCTLLLIIKMIFRWEAMKEEAELQDELQRQEIILRVIMHPGHIFCLRYQRTCIRSVNLKRPNRPSRLVKNQGSQSGLLLS